MPEITKILFLLLPQIELSISNVTSETGIFPAYHMSKTHWISVALDGSVEKEKLEWLLDLSFDLTAKRIKRHPKQ